MNLSLHEELSDTAGELPLAGQLSLTPRPPPFSTRIGGNCSVVPGGLLLPTVGGWPGGCTTGHETM